MYMLGIHVLFLTQVRVLKKATDSIGTDFITIATQITVSWKNKFRVPKGSGSLKIFQVGLGTFPLGKVAILSLVHFSDLKCSIQKMFKVDQV